MAALQELDYSQKEALTGCSNFRAALVAARNNLHEEALPNGTIMLVSNQAVKCGACCPVSVTVEVDLRPLQSKTGGRDDYAEQINVYGIGEAPCCVLTK